MKTREDLDEAQCQHPGCTNANCDLVLKPACHPRAGLRVKYVRTGALVIGCADCHAHVVSVKVASRSELRPEGAN